jgi:hypothetical protein
MRYLFATIAAGATAVILALSFASGFSCSWMSEC